MRWTSGELLTVLNEESAKQVDDAGGGRWIMIIFSGPGTPGSLVFVENAAKSIKSLHSHGFLVHRVFSVCITSSADREPYVCRNRTAKSY